MRMFPAQGAASSPASPMAIVHQAVSLPKSRLGLAVAIVAGLTLVRLIGLAPSVVDLFPDEAQYWAWSRDLAWGYFSKQPLLAWTIAAADHVCGRAEAWLLAPAPSEHRRGGTPRRRRRESLHSRPPPDPVFRHQPRRLCDRGGAL